MNEALKEVKKVNGIKISYCELFQSYIVLMPKKDKTTSTLNKFPTVDDAEKFIKDETEIQSQKEEYWWERD